MRRGSDQVVGRWPTVPSGVPRGHRLLRLVGQAPRRLVQLHVTETGGELVEQDMRFAGVTGRGHRLEDERTAADE